MDETRTIEAVKGVIASLFASQRTLRAVAPEYKWAGLGNLLGDFGEFIAMKAYALEKASAGSNGYDAKTAEGKTVQVKTGPCPGYIIDHVIALKRGGPDIPANMQWQTVEEAKAKDRVE